MRSSRLILAVFLALGSGGGGACAGAPDGRVGTGAGPEPERPDLLGPGPRSVETPEFRAEILSLELLEPQQGDLGLRLTNPTTEAVVAGVGYRVRVGGWFRNRELGTGDVYAFELPPGATEVVALRFYVPGYSPGTSLRLELGPAEPTPGRPGHGRLKRVAAERVYDLSGAPGARRELERFAVERTAHLEVFARRGGGLEESLSRMARDREEALAAVSRRLDLAPPERVRIVLYADPFLKWIDTGHWGTGWAFDSTLVEVVGGPDAMDPFHELVHLVAGRLGTPPALFREGLAVHVAERLGGDALHFLGQEGTVEEATCAARGRGELLPLDRLVRMDAIGGEETAPSVSYPQAAAFVAFLVERHGLDRFLEGYARMSPEGGVEEEPSPAFQAAFGTGLDETETAWLETLSRRCPHA